MTINCCSLTETNLLLLAHHSPEHSAQPIIRYICCVLYLVFCQGSIEVVSAIGRLLHEVVPVVRQLIHLVLDVWSSEVLVGNQTIPSV